MTTAVDLFAGAGGFTTGAEQAGVRVLLAANHWPAAVATHVANHPGVEHWTQDLHQAPWERVPRHDILLASPACVPADALVEMADGRQVRAADLEVGDEVLTHAGRGRRVVAAWSKRYTGEMVSITAWAGSRHPVEMTADHLVMIRRRGGHFSHLGGPQFVRADEVRVGDYVAFPRRPDAEGTAAAFVDALAPARVAYVAPESSVRGYCTTAGTERCASTRKRHVRDNPGARVVLRGDDDGLWWLIGHYLGDGEARHDRPQIGWSTGGDAANRERVVSTLARLGLRSWQRGPATNRRVFTSSKHLYAVCTAFGRLCHTKSIPTALAGLERRYAEQLLSGYMDADGSVRRDGLRATSTSLTLLQGMQRLCWSLGWSAGISKSANAKASTVQGRAVNCRDQWEMIVVPTPSPQSRTKFTDGMVWRGVRSLESRAVVDEVVFDFEVEDDHTFCLPGVVVHNCQGHSRAKGRERPTSDLSRSTAWAVVSALEHHRTSVAVVENVPEFTRWTLYPAWRMALNALGYSVAEHIIDAADAGVPQSRVRLFLVATRSTVPLHLGRPSEPRRSARDVVDFGAGAWSAIDRPGRSAATLGRIEAGRRKHGDRFLVAYYGSERGGRSLDQPIGTITTRDRHAVVDGDRMRMLTVDECRAAMGFPAGYILPADRKTAVHLLGNAVCPPVSEWVVRRVMEAA